MTWNFKLFKSIQKDSKSIKTDRILIRVLFSTYKTLFGSIGIFWNYANSDGKTQDIPRKQVLVRSWLWKIYLLKKYPLFFSNFAHLLFNFRCVTHLWETAQNGYKMPKWHESQIEIWVMSKSNQKTGKIQEYDFKKARSNIRCYNNRHPWSFISLWYRWFILA